MLTIILDKLKTSDWSGALAASNALEASPQAGSLTAAQRVFLRVLRRVLDDAESSPGMPIETMSAAEFKAIIDQIGNETFNVMALTEILTYLAYSKMNKAAHDLIFSLSANEHIFTENRQLLKTFSHIRASQPEIFAFLGEITPALAYIGATEIDHLIADDNPAQAFDVGAAIYTLFRHQNRTPFLFLVRLAKAAQLCGRRADFDALIAPLTEVEQTLLSRYGAPDQVCFIAVPVFNIGDSTIYAYGGYLAAIAHPNLTFVVAVTTRLIAGFERMFSHMPNLSFVDIAIVTAYRTESICRNFAGAAGFYIMTYAKGQLRFPDHVSFHNDAFWRYRLSDLHGSTYLGDLTPVPREVTTDAKSVLAQLDTLFAGKKYCVVAPMANYMSMVTYFDRAFAALTFKIIVDHLTELGYCVVINARNNSEVSDFGLVESETVKAFDIPLADFCDVVEHCGLFIGTRSGLCDLVAIGAPTARRIVVYPQEAENCRGLTPFGCVEVVLPYPLSHMISPFYFRRQMTKTLDGLFTVDEASPGN